MAIQTLSTIPGLTAITPDDDDDGNQSEPMDMSDDSSDSDSPDPPDQDDKQAEQKKRRLSAIDDSTQAATTNGNGIATKRARISEEPDTDAAKPARDLSTVWPHGIWQRVFTHLTPAMLFRLTRVNKRFKYLLEHCKDLKLAGRRAVHAVQQVDSESIWMQSRRSAYPSLPRPMPGRNEASMLRLVTATRCENCAKRPPPIVATTALNGGPGQHGVRPIWQFKRAVCGPCLKTLTLTDVELFQLKEGLRATDLRKGLTFVFLTKDLHVVSEQVARQHPNQGIVKVYLKSDVDDILNDFKEAQAFGGGAEEEWVKGLDELGKAATADAMRWQRWEDQLPFGTHLPTHLRKFDTVSFASSVKEPVQHTALDMARASVNTSSMPHPQSINTVHPLPKPVHSISFDNTSNKPTSDKNNARSFSGVSSTSHTSVHTRTHSNKATRSASEAQQAIRARRAEIERRAKLLVPSIDPAVLPFMDSFKAAILIAVPLSDPDWERLKPRLEAERELAEQLHYEQVQTMAALHAANPINWHYPEGVLPQSKEDDKEWEASQLHLRELLSFYADEVINGTWRGQTLTPELVPYFAADVLTRVHDRFHQDRAAKGEQNDSHTPGSFLSLDAMKWLFENKLRPLTEHHLRDMFMCAGCAEENLTRWFAFEGLIQHYGAKHTTDFSKGNITVHWQTAEWTDDPPFVTDVARLLPKHRKEHHGGSSRAHHRNDRNTSHRPAKDMLLSANPLFSVSQDSPKPAASHFDEDAALLNLGLVGRSTWAAFDNVRGLNASIRVLTVLSYVYQDFMDAHKTPLPLDLFMKAITINEKDSFTQLKDVNMLTCSFCEPTARQCSDPNQWLVEQSKKKHFKLVNLLNHFQLAHVQKGTPVSEWINVIDLPDLASVTDLITTPGMNDSKLAMINRAFPSVLPFPLPEIGEVQEPPPDSGLARRLVMKQFGQAPSKSKKKKATNTREYNPNDAIIPTKRLSGPIDMSKFDTDSLPSSSAPGPASNGTEAALEQLSLAPNTLAALQSFYSPRPAQEAVHKSQIQAASTHPAAAPITPLPLTQPYASPLAMPESSRQHHSPYQHDHVTPAADSDPNIAAIIESIRRSSARQPQQSQQVQQPPPMQHHHYQQPPAAYQTQSPAPMAMATPHAAYPLPTPAPAQELHPAYHGYPQAPYQPAHIPPMPPQQAWQTAQYPPYSSNAQQLQPVPLPNQSDKRLFYDSRTGQVYELVPDDN